MIARTWLRSISVDLLWTHPIIIIIIIIIIFVIIIVVVIIVVVVIIFIIFLIACLEEKNSNIRLPSTKKRTCLKGETLNMANYVANLVVEACMLLIPFNFQYHGIGVPKM